MKAYVEGDAGIWALALVGFVVLLFLAVQYARRASRAFGVWFDGQNARTQNGVIGLILAAIILMAWISIVMAAGVAGRLYERLQ